MCEQPVSTELDWSAVFLDYRDALIDTSNRIVGCRRRAEDVVQDAYIKITEMTELRGSVRQPVSYAFQVVRNLSIDRRRRLQFEQCHFVNEADASLHEISDGLSTPEHLAIQGQTLLALDRALSSLPERTRRAFEMYRLGDFTQKEIAQQMEVSPTLVNFMVKDALTACRQALFNQE
ncbi:hypothetical protein WH50_12965 [Pokkaliibacter plantistimulans]|uniref:Extracytoplasmic-function sigma-70 factor n=2 Tax=Pseudomonadota TaxID=1224 RepID=A0ABX5LZ22_9GAMM|nr:MULTISPECIES: sigma-70 family RNA polymerase sigma factor [Pokkaliibacter]MDH2433672.1 sigma-70 family RNA polymerase sigma factor [Pokkaliibacter sp. MBI-7]PPC75130.1 RNA polymerase factor sigma-70 [Pokkaliibacter plantistimulans]PXF30875.1 hypothetical protein WH50_12965 [Pokkaliibacter plantistimulans]